MGLLRIGHLIGLSLTLVFLGHIGCGPRSEPAMNAKNAKGRFVTSPSDVRHLPDIQQQSVIELQKLAATITLNSERQVSCV